MIRSFRPVLFAAFALVLASCSGTGGLLGGLGNLGGVGNGNIFGATSCNPGTQVQLANPLPFQTGVNPNIGQIIIVADGSNNNLYQNYSQFNITLVDGFGNQIAGGALQLVAFPSGPHPYDSDFYFQSGFGPLQSGMTYTAELSLVNFNGFNGCNYTLQSFRT